ncbi:subtilisin [Purpureocillium lavendulum]|uniref:Subtilisin n=1 Tax=Purpureocillium lavendulum TaxID=1247861 RepID=A0AB34FWQ2_9HYPO|nr:subtilisin [Purpureocillium lavendulum]
MNLSTLASSMVRTSALLSLAAAAATTIATTASSNLLPGGFIVEFEPNHDTNEVVAAVEKEGKTRMKLDYELFKGVSVQLNDPAKADEKVAKLEAMPAVKAVYPVRLYPMPKPKVEWIGSHPDQHFTDVKRRAEANETEDTFSPHVMTQVDKLRKQGITGKGVHIAVIDTGIDYKHPALGGCFGKGCLVTSGTDLVGDAYTGYNTPVPDNDPMDCGGHGSHVAGIIAAQPNKFGFTGAAPDVTLSAYKVFGCVGEVSNDVLIAAYNQAYQDGAKIITASIGGASGWSEDPWAVAVQRIVEKGVPCTVSAGNSGDHGLFYASGASDGKLVTSIASFDNAQTPILLYDVNYSIDGGDDVKFGYVPGEPSEWSGVTLEAYATSTDLNIKNDGCDPLPDSTPDLSKKIVLIRRGSCTFVQKATNAAAKGAKYVLILNNVGGAGGIDVREAKGIVGSGMTLKTVGDTLVTAIKAGKKVTLKMAGMKETTESLVVVQNNVTGGALSTYTSWGPTWEMDLKPQVGAPGGNILSTYPTALGGFAVLSGTSMACPLTAGIVALIAQVRGTFDPLLIEQLMSGNANPQLFNDGTRFYPFMAPPAQQGGGLVQAYDAAYATMVIEPSGLAFNDTDNFKKELKFKIQNIGKKEVTYKLSHVSAITMYTLGKDASQPYPDVFPNEAVQTAASLKFNHDSVTVAPNRVATISVEATAPTGLDARRLPVWGGWVAVNGSDGSSQSIPYQGLTGSLHKATVLVADDTWITHSTDKNLKAVAPNSTFTIPAPGNANGSSDLPALVVNLALGSAQLRAHIVAMTTCPPKNLTTEVWGTKTIGQPYGWPVQWATRGAGAYSWDGRLDSGNYAPPGKYKFVVRALKIFGNSKKKDEYDVSESPAFYIKYQ